MVIEVVDQKWKFYNESEPPKEALEVDISDCDSEDENVKYSDLVLCE